MLLTDAAMCSTEIIVSIDTVTGLNEPTSEHFELFPNPVDDYLFMKNVAGSEHFEIRSISGDLVLEGNTSIQSIDMRTISGGLYLITLSTADNSKKYTSLFLKN